MAFNLSVIAYAMPPLLIGEALAVDENFIHLPRAPLLGELAGVSPTERLPQCSNLFFMFK